MAIPFLRASISLPEEFRFDEIKRPGKPPSNIPPLGILARFHGEFEGTGINTIFRPNSAAPTTTDFANAVTPAPPTPPNENLLEINLITETMVFSKSLGNVPNRGLEAQNDIFLNGVPYVQTVFDVTNNNTGLADGPRTVIHFEPGLWMHVPATATRPVLFETLARMASIPHGTTINAQTFSPIAVSQGPPVIPPVSITPFVINSNPLKLIPFASLTATNTDTARLPQDLTKFIAQGTITQQILNDPNTLLRNAIQHQKILDTTTFTVSTAPTAPGFGGGISNISFLEGDPAIANPNAFAARMTATFWVETVEYTLIIPAGRAPLKLSPVPATAGQPVPVFVGVPPHEITHPITITVTATQIQYSQVVLLNFAGLTWPHVAVATLAPKSELVIPLSAWSAPEPVPVHPPDPVPVHPPGPVHPPEPVHGPGPVRLPGHY